MNPFQSLHNYEEFIYTLKQKFPSVQVSNVVLVRRGKRMATLQGEILFAEGYRINLRERLTFDEELVVLEDYSYELWCKGEKIAWYDAQPHPNDQSLASTHPHHKNVPPDIKHNRIPAPQMSFNQPNVTNLIGEIEGLIQKKTQEKTRE
jgi:hypothetical protein